MHIQAEKFVSFDTSEWAASFLISEGSSICIILRYIFRLKKCLVTSYLIHFGVAGIMNENKEQLLKGQALILNNNYRRTF